MTALAAVLTGAANLLMRSGVTGMGGVSLPLGRFLGDLLQLARQPLFIIGLLLYGTATLVWFVVISTEHLSSTYPVLVSVSFAIVTLGAIFFFHESFAWQKGLGLMLLLGGIVLMAR
jgi:multidrug transporter EmrE-like cation transporter